MKRNPFSDFLRGACRRHGGTEANRCVSFLLQFRAKVHFHGFRLKFVSSLCQFSSPLVSPVDLSLQPVVLPVGSSLRFARWLYATLKSASLMKAEGRMPLWMVR